MPAERCPEASTGGTALDYPGFMRISTIILSAFLFPLITIAGCKDEASPNTPGEFGDPCIEGSSAGTPDGCAEGLTCWKGYCEEVCANNDDCQPVDGWTHECVAGQCQILCKPDSSCPETLATPMECWINGMWCAARDD